MKSISNKTSSLVSVLSLSLLIAFEYVFILFFYAYIDVVNKDAIPQATAFICQYLDTHQEEAGTVLGQLFSILFYGFNFAILVVCNFRNADDGFVFAFRIVIYLYSAFFSLLDLLKSIGFRVFSLTGVELPMLVIFIALDSAVSIWIQKKNSK